ncbi:MAG TPA: carbohydrate kinase, partial [bacterium]|nr:carbohydrate kinase [bacterium]
MPRDAVEVMAIGEVLADFVPEGGSYVLRPGGAPANVAVNLSRAGVRAGITGKIGADFLGGFLKAFLEKNRVNVKYLTAAKGRKNGLVFVFLDKDGERDFTFYGHPSADRFLSARDIPAAEIKKCRILHFGSISMMAPLSRVAVLNAVNIAKRVGRIVSYDPNVRLNLWEGRHNQARASIKRWFKYADIIKLSDSELRFLFNARPQKEALAK